MTQPSITAKQDGDNAVITMTIAQGRDLRDYLDTVDITDLALNPDTYGLTADEAEDYSGVLGSLATALAATYPY